MEYGTLSSDGARLLRLAREAIREHPEQLSMANWCGTNCCIAGHVMDAAGYGRFSDESIAPQLLGFQGGWKSDHGWDYNHPLTTLFLRWTEWDSIGYVSSAPETSAAAIRQIDEFLFKYGFPPDEIIEVMDESQKTQTA